MTYEQRLAEKLLLQQANKQPEAVVDILQACLPHQKEFILDPSKRKYVLGTRRSSKSFMMAIYLLWGALSIPRGTFAYYALTVETAENIMWKDIFESIIAKYHLGIDLNSNHEMHFTNGSIIYLSGLDATPRQKAKLRGQKYNIVAIDECQDFYQDLDDIINGVLKMGLAQTGGTVILGGTPGVAQGNHYWWRINKPDTLETEWKRFFFDWRHNTSIEPTSGKRVCDAIKEETDKDIALKPLIVNTDKWKMEVEGQWVTSASARVYSFEPTDNATNTPFTNEWKVGAHYGLGCDLGFSPDPTSFVIAAYNTKYDDKWRIIKSYKRKEMLTADIANEIKRLDNQYHFESIVADAGALGKQIVADLNLTYGLRIEAADKMGKLGHINMLNSDFITQDIIIYQPDNEELVKELQELIWDRKKLLELGKREEDSRFDNHCTDAMLYNYLHSRHHWWRAPKPKMTVEESNAKQQSDLISSLWKKQNTGASSYQSIYKGIDFTNQRPFMKKLI